MMVTPFLIVTVESASQPLNALLEIASIVLGIVTAVKLLQLSNVPLEIFVIVLGITMLSMARSE